MIRRPIFWIVAVVLCAVAAWFAWNRGNRPGAQPSVQVAVPAAPAVAVSRPLISSPAVSTNVAALTAAALRERVAHYRLSNTTEPLDALLRRDSALVLENARWDTTKPLDLNIPAHLRAQGDPGTYIVKADGPVDAHFRDLLRQAGLSLVSYIPHDAWLVRGSEAQIAAITGQRGVGVVLPWEPYYKLKSGLLPMGVEQEAIPAGMYLNLVLFADDRASTLRELAALGASVVGEGPSPFGPVVTVQARPDSLVAIAQLRGVQIIERSAPRALANDLARVRMGVSVNTTNASNYFGLTGTNVLVAVTDSGVDTAHPDLVGRVITNSALSGIDFEGHGTHVAAIIAGDGTASGTVSNVPPGSIKGANYRGKAPGAKLFSMRLGESPVSDLDFDAYVQQQAALTNALISNNSWGEVGVYDYDIAAASYDAAVRDALPFQEGSQPVTFVFSAGNDGSADNGGLAGFAGTVHSPATGKNVISVGAIEQFRNITNKVVIGGQTNAVWKTATDSDNQVAAYSSRGNVGIGVEGDSGRFKPDVVAPGSWVVSARSSQWDEVAYYNITNYMTEVIAEQTVAANQLHQYSIFVPSEAVGMSITVIPTDLSTNNSQTNLALYVRVGDSPTKTTFDALTTNQIFIPPSVQGVNFNSGSGYFYAVGNPYRETVAYSIRTVVTVTNDLADYFRVLKLLNDALGGKYRYESGTSMAAPAVSGVLALMQEFYAAKYARTNSPALMKALLINGARSSSSIYDMEVQNTINHQGWGLVNLPTSLPRSSATNSAATNVGPSSFLFYDQSPTNALATGQSMTRLLTLNNNSQTRPLRVTLVWTDPPGNPAAGVKLVNDLDLVVTNKDTGDVYFGNDIPGSSDFNSIADSNAPPVLDFINNVENVYIGQPLGTNFSITVRARRVNVNAVTANTNDVVQDYALVISCGNGEVTNSFTVADAVISTNIIPFVTFMTNTIEGVTLPLFNQTVGANAPLLSGVNGMTNQWHFYVVTNTQSLTNANFTNAAFLTFLPPTLATPRMGVRSDVRDEHSRPEADIDMYVSTNAALTNLDPIALAGADRSVGRGGTETIVYSNAASPPGLIYYVGIKSEDQMAGQYAFYSVFSDEPFSSKDEQGNLFLRGFPVPNPIPDGTPSRPGAAYVFGIATEPIKVRRVIVTNIITHENFGDLFANLTHNNAFAVLHNHTFGNGDPTQLFAYDDSLQGDIPGSKKTDGPGSLQSFVGLEGVGQWLETVVDDAPASTGRVDRLVIKIEPQDLEGLGDVLTIQGGGWGYDFIEVPAGATNLMIGLSENTLPVDLYVRRGDFPDFSNYDKKVTVQPNLFPSKESTNALTVTKFDLPPLQAGIYYIGVYNPNASPQTVRLRAHIDIDLDSIVPTVFSSLFPLPIIDDAVTIGSINVPSTQLVARVEVGVAIRHPRVSDLALQLVSPKGKRVLLFENRGYMDTNGLGSITTITNVVPATTNGGPAAATNIINAGSNQGTLIVNYSFFDVPDEMHVYYDGTLIYNTGLVGGSNQTFAVNFGPGVSSNLVVIMNEGGNADTNTQWNYTATVIQRAGNYFTFTEDTNKSPQLLKFATPPFRGSTSNVVVWSNGFDTPTVGNYSPSAGQYFAGGWIVNSGQIDVLYDGVFGQIADSPTYMIDINGPVPATISTNIATTVGTVYALSLAYTKNPDGPTPQATVLVNGGPLMTLVPATPNTWTALNWQHTNVTFVATGTNTALSLRSDVAGAYGVLFDTLVLTRTQTSGNNFYPEEPLTEFKGDAAKGTWKLEAWDSRAGATNPAPELSSWQLSFLFENNEALPINLQTGVTVTNSIPPGRIQILAVDVPPWANAATNTLVFADLPLLVWFNQTIAPTGNTPPDTLFFGGSVTNGVQVLTTNSVPPLLPGQRYYIGLQNTNATTATYAFRVDFDITALTNALPYTAVTTSNGIPRYFTYTVSPNATAVAFDLYGMDGNLTLVAHQGPSIPSLQAGGYDYGSFNPGLLDEQILVITNSAPIALQPGTTWYLGVFNTTPNPVNYTIRATEYTNAIPTIITLTNQIPYIVTSNNAAPGTLENYRYVVTTAAARVQFETFGADGDFTLVARKGLPLPDLATFNYMSANAGTNDELIVVFTNSVPVALTPGDWFITAVKVSAGLASYNIMATEWNVTGQPIVITNIDVSTGDFCITWNSLPGVRYIVQSTPVINPTAWTNASPVITANDVTTTWCTPITGTMQYFHVIEAAASTLPASTAPPAVIPPPTISSVVVTPGGVVLTWSGPVSASYHVQWTGALSPLPITWNTVPTPITSTNGTFIFTDDGSQTGGLGPLRFYRLTAP